MHIQFVEISNFRKLKSIRIDFTTDTTLFVGANNSGKTSAMLALRYFLIDSRQFHINDFTLCHWQAINEIGQTWEAMAKLDDGSIPLIDPWMTILPSLDIWVHVEEGETHLINKVYPVMGWSGGALGARLQWRPSDLIELYKDYTQAVANVAAVRTSANAAALPKLWPQNLVGFLQQRLQAHFSISAFSLNPSKQQEPISGVARPQDLPEGVDEIEGNPFKGLIQIDEINAQRGFGGEARNDKSEGEPHQTSSRQESRRLSQQLRAYYASHLDPLKNPNKFDLEALQAIETAQEAFDKRLEESFGPAFLEVEGLNYPGITDPKLKVSTRLRPVDGLNHDSALHYEIDVMKGNDPTPALRLPEDYNGLGYQNLISMIFKLMSYRDAWMRVGKAKKDLSELEGDPPPRLHLVLIEEPEAYLHAQVQQVFIRQAYSVLRKHADLGSSTLLRTQLVVSTHSSHIAHERPFESLRYFRRLPASKGGDVPVSTVVNLTEVFGNPDDTARFVIRYLQAAHCDLFFADAAIMIEGPAERMLVPHFVRTKFPYLNQCYITWIEIGGSHAHKFEPLIKKLGLLTLVITDIDAADASGSAVATARGQAQKTNNNVLKTWLPKKDLIDDLLVLPEDGKVLAYDHLSSVRVAYQSPVQVSPTLTAPQEEGLPYTFEDALVLENLELFRTLSGTGFVKKFSAAIAANATIGAMTQQMFTDLRSGNKKAEFALDVLELKDPVSLSPPDYIRKGLDWLERQLRRKLVEVLPPAGSTAGGNP